MLVTGRQGVEVSIQDSRASQARDSQLEWCLAGLFTLQLLGGRGDVLSS